MANPFTSLADALGEQLAFLERHPTPANLVLRGLLGALLHVLLAYLHAPRPCIALGLSPRRPLRDWHPFPNEQDAQSPAQLRRWRRLRAFIGWILRGCPNRGLSAARRSRVPARPARTARAPP
jgi:hypothetical protein